MFPQENEKAIYEWRLGGITNIMNNVPECSYTKCVDVSTQKIVSFALWETTQPRKAEGEGSNEDEDEGDKANGIPKGSELPAGTNVPLMNVFNEATNRIRKQYVDNEKDYGRWLSLTLCRRGTDRIFSVLRALATHPEYQGKGCGTLLLRTGLEKVDADGKRAWLEASPQGHSLYHKFGWKDVDEIAIDLGKYGCAEQVQITTCMRREVSTSGRKDDKRIDE